MGKWDFDTPEWDDISLSAKDLLTKMLTYDIDQRIDGQTALNHEWFQQFADQSKQPRVPTKTRALRN